MTQGESNSKFRMLVSALLIGLLLLAGCEGSQAASRQQVNRQSKPRRLNVVASIYPLGFMLKEVLGKAATVTNLTPSGTEAHEAELSTKAVNAIDTADLVVYIGGGFQPALEAAIKKAPKPQLKLDALNLLDGSALLAQGKKADPHFWLDPIQYGAVADKIIAALGEFPLKLSQPELDFRRNAFKTKMDALIAVYRSGLSNCGHKDIFTTHSAFGYLAQSFGLNQVAIGGGGDHAEVTPRQLATVIDLAKSRAATTIFYEDTESEKMAATVAREAGGLNTQELHSIESPDESAGPSQDYFALMEENLVKLAAGLGCHAP